MNTLLATPESAEQKPSDTTFREVRSINLFDLIRIVLQDGALSAKEKKNLINELRKNNPGTNDRWTYRYAILALVFAVILTIVAISFLALLPKTEIPSGLVSIGSAAVGGLAGLLSPGRTNEN